MSAPTASPELANKVHQLLSTMTLEEKVGQMTQVDFSVIAQPEEAHAVNPIDQAKLDQAVLGYHVGSILNTPYNKAQSVETWRLMQDSIRATADRSRLKIPVIYGIDAIHGATYTQGATLFPQAISMAATFNSELSFQSGIITAREVRASGLQWNFAPVMDIGRQPLWPRFWETYGEDVHLAVTMGTRYIDGYQGDDFSAKDKGPTCLKHYIGYSLPFNGKDRTPAYISERVLREYFLPTFAAGVKAGSPTVMINSSEVDGIPGHANSHYLNTILRGELGFQGFTVSDWEDIKRLFTRDKLAASEQEAVKIAVMAGVDMSMVPFDFSFYEILLQLINNGEVPITRIDEAVSRILTVKFQAGLFNPPKTLSAEENFATAEATEINRQAAREAIILAKNQDGILPLAKDASILVTGPTANLLSVMNGGWTITWQGNAEDLYPKDKPTVLAALNLKSTGKITYVGGRNFNDPIDLDQVAAEAARHDYILLCLGESTYTETDGNIASLALPRDQQRLAETALSTGKPVILLILGGRPRIITSFANRASAVLLGFLPGMEGGMAIADIVFGDYNPDAKLPVTYPRDTNDLVTYDYKPIENFAPNKVDPLYAFGHGLSYTTFSTSNLRLNKNSISIGEAVTVSVDVQNTGSRSGKETVLVYLTDVAASVTRPNKQLKAFEKVALEPGETRNLQITLSADTMSFIGIDLKRIIEPGEFVVTVGTESIGFTILAN